MKLPKAWLFELALVVLGNFLMGYLTVEALDSFTGAVYRLPISDFLVTSLRLAPTLAGAIVTVILVSFASGFVYWLFRATPSVLTKYIGAKARTVRNVAKISGRPAGEAAPLQSQSQSGALRVGELKLEETAETQPFVDIVQLEGYPLNIYAAVTKEEGREGYTYVVIEPSMSEEEKASLADLKKLLIDELDVDLRNIGSTEKAERYISAKVKELAKKYGYKISPPTMTKLLYYMTRDFIHLGKIEPLMRDKLIEDISCDGAGIPIYIWYRDYESIPTNIIFETEDELDTFVSKLAYSAGKHVSLAEPIVDASLTDGSRLHLTFGKEITQRGSTFTIRKFRTDPLTIIDLIRYNTMSSDVAAYLWYLIEKKLALLIAGGTASGKSIPRDEKVWIYQNGHGRLVSIGRFYDEMARSGEVSREGVYETVSCRGIETAAFGHDLRVGHHRVKSIVRHRSPKKIFVVKTRSGRSVKATGDHSLFTIADGEVLPYQTSLLTPGMFVAIPRYLPDALPAVGSIDLLKLLRDAKTQFYVENVADYVRMGVEKLGQAEASKLVGIRVRTIREGISRAFLVAPVKGFLSLMDAAGIAVETKSLWIRAKTNATFRVPASLSVSKPLARFLGFWAAEGMYQEKGLSLFQLDARTREDMIDSAFRAFGIKGKPSKGSDRTRIDFNSSVVKSIVAAMFGKGSGSASKRIPSFVLEDSNQILAEFLRGYFTGDASAGAVIEATTKSEELAYQLQYVLLRFDIVARKAPKVVDGKTYHRISIFGQANLRKFEESIGFLDSPRQSKLRAAVQAEVHPHTNVDTIPGIAPLLKEALAFKGGKEKKEVWSNWHSYWSPTKNKSMSRNTLLSFVKVTGAQDSVAQRLLNLAYSDIFWDEVVDVSEVEYDGEFVYDLEVPGAENFVGGSGGVFLHNTTTLNALSMFIEPGEKIVSVEDTPELNLPHENWIQSVTRGVGTASEITMFDLLKASLRQRPDVLIVGEIRGEEAFTLMQSISTGHGGLGTIHADSVEAVINRLTTEPMNIPRSLVGTTLDCIVMQLKIRLADRSVRRVVAVTEVVGHDTRTGEIILNDAFKWDPVVDKFSFTGRSKLFDKITTRFGAPARGDPERDRRTEGVPRLAGSEEHPQPHGGLRPSEGVLRGTLRRHQQGQGRVGGAQALKAKAVKTKAVKAKGSSMAAGFWGMSYILMQPYLARFETYFADLDPTLSKAGMRITYKAYVAGTVVASMLAIIGGALTGFLIAFYLNTFLFFRLLMPFGFALLAGALTFSVFYIYPQFTANSRGRKLDSQLSFTVGHMAVLASAGLTPEKMFHSLAEEESADVVNEEAKMIVRDMSLLGMDLEHALEAEQKRSPSERFSDFLDGFISASRTGGEVKAYLLRTAASLMLDKRLKARSIGESVGFVAELYTILLVVTPLLLLIMFSVIGIISGSIGGFSILTLIYLITYALVPLGGLSVLVIADSTVGKEVA